MLITALAHSILSETKLVSALPSGGMQRTIIRYALHAMSIFMLLSAATVVWTGTPRSLIVLIGTGWVLIGLSGLIVSRGKHRGWPIITGAGVFALVGACM